MTPAPSRARTLRAATAESLAIDAATVETVDALSRAGIRSLLLKGPAMARLLYEPGEGRSWDDADLLVPPELHRRAIEVLAAIGFRPRISDPVERGSVPYAVHLVRAARSAGGAAPESIDLHLGFAGVEAPAGTLWDSLSAEPDRVELFGRPVEVPSVPARLALVALHAAAHGPGHVRSRRDLDRAIERFGDSEWAAAASLARDWQATDFFVVGLGLDPAGAELLGRLGISHVPSRAAAMRGDGMPRALRSVEQLRRAAGAGERLRLVARKVVPSPELLRTWKPLARRGRGGLAVAYLWRPFWLLCQLPPLVFSYLRAARR